MNLSSSTYSLRLSCRDFLYCGEGETSDSLRRSFLLPIALGICKGELLLRCLGRPVRGRILPRTGQSVRLEGHLQTELNVARASRADERIAIADVGRRVRS